MACAQNQPRMDKDALTAKDWVYKGEGNMNIVFGERAGDCETGSNGPRVLRVRKTLPRYDQGVDAGLRALETASQFVERHIRPLFSESTCEIPRWTLAPASQEFLAALDATVRSAATRARERTDRGVDQSQALVAVSSDATIFEPNDQSTICVEIKPKSATFIPVVGRDGKPTQTCRFCLAQAAKGRDDSRYCPFLLFSGSEASVLDALRALSDAPHGYLRVFVGGRPSTFAAISPTTLDAVAQALCASRVLASLHVVQQQLLSPSANGASYLIGRTLQDCSLMVSIAGDGTARRRVSVVDLDPKPSERLERYREQEQALAAFYASVALDGPWRGSHCHSGVP